MPAKNVKSKSKPLNLTKAKASSSDNIKTLKQMNNSLQNSYRNKEPFIPSGAIHETLSPTTSPSRKRHDVSSSFGGSSPPRSRSPIANGSYLIDMTTSNWKSDQHRNFSDNYAVLQAHDNRPAGLPSNSIGQNRSSYAWDLRGGAADNEKYIFNTNEPESQSEYMDDNDRRRSEQVEKFQWREPAEPTKVLKRSQTSAPMAIDGTLFDASKWTSEYDETAAKFERNRHEQHDDPVAGISTANGEYAPTLFAWEKQKGLKQQPQPAEFAHLVGNSEYKTQYTPHSMEYQGTAKGQKNKSKVFATNTEANPYSEYRKTSLYRDDYTEKHVDHLNGSVTPNTIVRDPIKYAWSLVEDHKEAKPTTNTKPSLVRQNSITEHTREYNWPPSEALGHDQAVHKDRDSDRIRTILQQQSNGSLRNMHSEYEEQFHDVSNYVEPSSAVVPKNENPPQFAWSVYDGEIEEPRRRAPKSPVRQARENSEYHTKYRWPVATRELSHPAVRDDYESKFGKLYAVDPEDQDPSKWKTEYDEQCAKLRRKQFDASYVAGMKTRRITGIPSNFVWSESDGVESRPAPIVNDPHHVPREHFQTEYDDQFLRWKVPSSATNPYQTKKQEDRLNLFEPSEEEKNVTPIKSEYEAKFKGIGSPSQDDLYKSIRFKSQSSFESAPPQFAWPLVDKQPIAPPPKTPSIPQEKSEYEESFRWPQGSSNQVAIRRPVELTPPMALDTYEKENWKSEYAQRSSEDLKVKKVPDAAAGMTQDHDGNVPTFFAWPKQESSSRPVTSNPYVQYANPEVGHTEYAEQFQGFAGDTSRPKIFKESDQLQLFAEKRSKTPKTEYESNFKGVDVTATPRPSSTDHKETNLPPQFAWSLLPPPPPTIPATPVNKASGKFDDRTEYGTKFQWKDENDYRPQPVVSSASINHLHSSGVIVNGGSNNSLVNAATNDDGTPSSTSREWSTEYQDRCQQLRDKQIEMQELEKQKRFATPTAGITNKRDENAPAFYAWNGSDVPPPQNTTDVPKKVTVPTEKTEYDTKFVNWQESKPKTLNNKQENTFTDIFGPQISSFDDQQKTEYDSKFNPQNSVQDGVNLPPRMYHPRYERTLPCTNLDRTMPPPPPASSSEYLFPKPVVDKYRFKGSSEYRDHFAWPEKSAYSTTPTPLTPRRYCAPYGAVTGAVPPESNRESRVNVLNTVAGTTTGITVPLTETQTQFAWPTAIKDGSTANYKLMDEKMEKLLHQRHPTASKSQHEPAYLQSTKPRSLSASPTFRKSNVYRPTFSRSQAIAQTIGRSASPESTPPRKKTTTVGSANNQNKYQHRATFVSDHHSMGEGSTVMTGSGAGDSSYSEGYEESKSPSYGTRTVTTTNTNTTATRVPSSFQATTGTLMSQDSLNATTTATNTITTNSMATMRPRTTESATTATTTTTGSTSSNGDRYNNNKASMTMDSLNLETSQQLGARDFRHRETDINSSSNIPGLRATEYQTMSHYRSRSAPPRKHLGTTFPPSQKTKVYVDNTPSNPVLVNRRYPSINDQQGTRWSTETKDNFRWRSYNPTTNVTTTVMQ